MAEQQGDAYIQSPQGNAYFLTSKKKGKQTGSTWDNETGKKHCSIFLERLPKQKTPKDPSHLNLHTLAHLFK